MRTIRHRTTHHCIERSSRGKKKFEKVYNQSHLEENSSLHNVKCHAKENATLKTISIPQLRMINEIKETSTQTIVLTIYFYYIFNRRVRAKY